MLHCNSIKTLLIMDDSHASRMMIRTFVPDTYPRHHTLRQYYGKLPRAASLTRMKFVETGS